jgi:hypothetical protein
MPEGLTPQYLRHRARYWHSRAERENDPEKQARLRQTAGVLEREADERERQQRERDRS